MEKTSKVWSLDPRRKHTAVFKSRNICDCVIQQGHTPLLTAKTGRMQHNDKIILQTDPLTQQYHHINPTVPSDVGIMSFFWPFMYLSL
jgi:hypothetical protein